MRASRNLLQQPSSPYLARIGSALISGAGFSLDLADFSLALKARQVCVMQISANFGSTVRTQAHTQSWAGSNNILRREEGGGGGEQPLVFLAWYDAVV